MACDAVKSVNGPYSGLIKDSLGGGDQSDECWVVKREQGYSYTALFPDNQDGYR